MPHHAASPQTPPNCALAKGHGDCVLAMARVIALPTKLGRSPTGSRLIRRGCGTLPVIAHAFQHGLALTLS